MEYKKALVTGGAGFIGSHLARALLRDGLEVVVIDDLSMGTRKNVPDEAAFIEGDILDIEVLHQAFEGVDVVFHLAAVVSIRASVAKYFTDAETNLMGTLRILEAAGVHKVRKFIYASSMAVYTDSVKPDPIPETYATEPISPYGIAKLASEKYVANVAEQSGMDAAILRFFNTYGPGQTLTPYVGVITIFTNKLLHDKPPTIFGDGEQLRDFVHVSDIVQANLLAMKKECAGETFNVGTGQATSVNEIAQLLISRINPDIKPEYSDARSEELRNSIADISKAQQILGYQPTSNLKKDIGEIIEHIQGL